MLVGFVLFFVGILKSGSLTNLISQSVLSGFLSASALVIALNNMKYILGIHVPRFTYTHETIVYFLTHLDETNGAAVALGLPTWAFLYYLREAKRKKSVFGIALNPATTNRNLLRAVTIFLNVSNLLIITIGAAVSKALIDHGSNLDVVGLVPSGFLPPSFAFMGFRQCTDLLPASMAIAFVSFAGNWSVHLTSSLSPPLCLDAHTLSGQS